MVWLLDGIRGRRKRGLSWDTVAHCVMDVELIVSATAHGEVIVHLLYQPTPVLSEYMSYYSQRQQHLHRNEVLQHWLLERLCCQLDGSIVCTE